MSRIRIMAGGGVIEGVLKNTPSARQFLRALPVKGIGSRWGREIYFDVDVCLKCDNPTLRVRPGDITFWPEGNGVALFFGKTSLMTELDPVPDSEVEVIGTMQGDFECLGCVVDGTEIVIDKWVKT